MRTRLLLAAALAALVVACGGSGGGGGSPSTPTPTPPPPPSGELFGEECVGYVLVSTYHDGEGGYYEETTVDSLECGYIAPSLDVSIDDTYGDRFKPVVITVDYTVQGETSGAWTHDVGERINDTTLHIYGDGSEGDGYVLINDEEYRYSLRAEPRCASVASATGIQTDCSGEWTRGPTRGLIYYGEDDTQRVTMELAIIFRGTPPEGERLFQRELSIGESQQVASMVRQYQEFFDRSNIYIDVELAGVWFGSLGSLRTLESDAALLPVDIALGWGYSYEGTCGVAYPNTSFPQGYPPAGLSKCGADTDLHELGHAVGLAHGPSNSANPATGYIFPDFGHGANEVCGFPYRDIMAYGGSRISFWNSLMTCGEMFPDKDIYNPDRMAGGRTFGDSAYHWNRVRYDLSLVNNEHGPAAQLYEVHVRPQRDVIYD